jgi:hypothetical protein
MRVNKARHQYTPVGCDNPDIGILIDSDRACGYALNGIASNQHI